MADKPQPTFLSRWSQRKHEAARAQTAPAQAPVAAAAPAVAAASAPAEPSLPLPPVESLTMESDFTPFLTAKVEETVKRAALKKLFSDPHFNVMDGLDVYIDDYSKPDPVPAGLLDKLADAYKALDEKPAEAAPVAESAEAPAAPPAEDDEPRG